MGEKTHACEYSEPPSKPLLTLCGPLPSESTLLSAPPSPSGESLTCLSFPLYLESIPGARPIGRKRTETRTDRFRRSFFPEATPAQWNDWHWQMTHRTRTVEELGQYLELTDRELATDTTAHGMLPLAITPYYLSLLWEQGADYALRKSIVPRIDETIASAGEAADPLDEAQMSPVPGLVHRYPDRVLFLVTTHCSAFCRYCTRSRIVGSQHQETPLGMDTWARCVDYIRNHTEIRDVLISGGDPLTLSDDSLEWLLKNLRAIPHVEIIRIGTKTPSVLPQRITPNLVRILRRYHPLWMSLHFTHPDELTHETIKACTRLADAGIPLGSQTVLLAGINDSAETLKGLYHGLLRARVRPYYLYQCDPIPGSGHFRTPVATGQAIMRALRGHTSGYAIPTYVIDAPGGGGKIPVGPDYITSRDSSGIHLQNYEGKHYHYPDTPCA